MYTVYVIWFVGPTLVSLHRSDLGRLFLTNALLLFTLLLSDSVCTSDKERIKVSLYGGLKLEGEILVRAGTGRVNTSLYMRCMIRNSSIFK